MKAHTTWLSDAEKSRIVDQALDTLANVGMRFAGSKVLPLLEAEKRQYVAILHVTC